MILRFAIHSPQDWNFLSQTDWAINFRHTYVGSTSRTEERIATPTTYSAGFSDYATYNSTRDQAHSYALISWQIFSIAFTLAT